MPEREEYSYPIECPKCGRKGDADYDEYTNPVPKGFDARVLSVSKGFIKTEKTITCCRCKTLIKKLR